MTSKTNHESMASGAQEDMAPTDIASGTADKPSTLSFGGEVHARFLAIHEALWFDEWGMAIGMLLGIKDDKLLQATWAALRDDKVDSIGPNFCKDMQELVSRLSPKVIL